MDPNATLRYIAEVLREYTEHRADELEDACQLLHDWLQNLGFAPEWDRYPDAAEHFKGWEQDHRP